MDINKHPIIANNDPPGQSKNLNAIPIISTAQEIECSLFIVRQFFALLPTLCVWTVGHFEVLLLRFATKPKQTFLLLIFFFVKRQNFVLALPAQRTGLSIYH